MKFECDVEGDRTSQKGLQERHSRTRLTSASVLMPNSYIALFSVGLKVLSKGAIRVDLLPPFQHRIWLHYLQCFRPINGRTQSTMTSFLETPSSEATLVGMLLKACQAPIWTVNLPFWIQGMVHQVSYNSQQCFLWRCNFPEGWYCRLGPPI